MPFSAKEMIRNRKSVRSFNGKPLSDGDKSSLESYVMSLENPFGVPVTFRVLDVKENNLSSPVVIGADTYLAAKVKMAGHYEIALGYSFEKACLYALSLGLGTVMLAASINRSTFEKVMDIQKDEVLPAASPVGYPADKRSMREVLMRKGLRADDRMPFNKLFFDKTFESGLTKEKAGVYSEALEMVRLAPSAVNKQPWRAVVDGERVHFYEYKTMKEYAGGDLQKVDVGIALAHFDMTMEENGMKGAFVFEDPKIKIPQNACYIVTYERKG